MTTLQTLSEALPEDAILIPEANYASLREGLARLSRRAERLSVASPAIEDLGVKDVPELCPDTGEEIGVRRFHAVRVVSGEPVRLPGWRFAAVVEHTSDGNLLRSAPDAGDLPAHYRDDKPTCDHCGVYRRRAETFVLRHEDGRYTRVGRQCLRDFVGDDSAARMVALASLLASLEALVTEAEGDGLTDDMAGYGGGRGPLRVRAERYLAYVVAAIAARGWCSRGAARNPDGELGDAGREATADMAMEHMRPPPRFRRLFDAPTDAQVEEARLALAWGREIDADTSSDYLHNCRVLSHQETWTARYIGIGASIVAAYQREQARLNQQRYAARLPSVFLGAVGDRFGGKGTKKAPAPAPLAVTVLGKYEMAGDYGLTTIVRMQAAVDAEHVADLVWFASGSVDVAVGDHCLLTGTVKRQEASKRTGRLETHLTRCRLAPMAEGV